MTVEELKKKVIILASSEVGYHEKASNFNLDDKTANSGTNNWTKYARDLDKLPNFYNGKKNGYAYCDVFIDWLFVTCFGENLGREMLCQPEKSLGAGCLYSAQYYKQAGRWYTFNPQIGDQVFFSYSAGEYSHTGIVEFVADSTIHTIEGNTSDQVARRSYFVFNNSIAGYGRPRWELAAQGNENPQPVTEEHTWTPMILGYNPDNWVQDCETLQSLLNSHGFDSGKVDGYWGENTQSAVDRARDFYGLKKVCECDLDLWKKLLEIC